MNKNSVTETRIPQKLATRILGTIFLAFVFIAFTVFFVSDISSASSIILLLNPPLPPTADHFVIASMIATQVIYFIGDLGIFALTIVGCITIWRNRSPRHITWPTITVLILVASRLFFAAVLVAIFMPFTPAISLVLGMFGPALILTIVAVALKQRFLSAKGILCTVAIALMLIFFIITIFGSSHDSLGLLSFVLLIHALVIFVIFIFFVSNEAPIFFVPNKASLLKTRKRTVAPTNDPMSKTEINHVARMQALQQLFDGGLISKEELETKRQEYLDSL